MPQKELRRSQVSPARRRLVDVVTRIGYGRITDLHVRRGEPVWDPPPHILSTLKITGHSAPRRRVPQADFVLNREVVQLLEYLVLFGDGVVERIEIVDGLPVRLEVPGTLEG